jgi:cysteine protease ATG4
MVLAHALRRHLLGHAWRLNTEQEQALPEVYINLLKWFLDYPLAECPFSLHNMCSHGHKYGKEPGEWYGPTDASHVLRDLMQSDNSATKCGMSLLVLDDGVVYIDQIEKTCCPPTNEGGTLKQQPQTEDTSAGFLDPLFNPPVKAPAAPWSTALMILMPLRLGLDSLHGQYIPALQQTFSFPQSVGIIGGKRAHSVYFVGAQGSDLHLLDPHFTQQSVKFAEHTYSIADCIRTVRCTTPLTIDIARIDPSLALGFYCRDRQDFEDFCQRVAAVSAPHSMACPEPLYASLTSARHDLNACVAR